MIWQTLFHFSVHLVKRRAFKWCFEGSQFVNYTAERPDIGSFHLSLPQIVGRRVPDFGARVHGCSRLRAQHVSLYNFRHVHVCQLDSAVFAQENVGWFHVSMGYLHRVELSEASCRLKKHRPYKLLGKLLTGLFRHFDLLGQISIVDEFGNDTGDWPLP